MPRKRTIIFSLGLALLLYVTLVAGIDAQRTFAAMRQLALEGTEVEGCVSCML